MFTNSDFQDWKRMPITQTLINGLHNSVETIKTEWARGAFADPVANAKMLGMVAALSEIIEIVANGASMVDGGNQDD